MPRASRPKAALSRSPITLFDWVTAGKLVSDWTDVITGSTLELVAVGSEPEGYVPGGGRCVKLYRPTHPTNYRAMKQITVAAPYNLVNADALIECPVYYPSDFVPAEGAVAGLGIYACSGGSAANRYNKEFYPSGEDVRKGWNWYSYPLQSLNGSIGMGATGAPDPTALNYFRVALENTNNPSASYCVIGPITARRRAHTLVTISFDDGNSSIYASALPILSAAGLKATCGVITGAVGIANKMTIAQLHELVDTYGWSMQPHSVTHSNILVGGLTEAQVKAEVIGSTNFLRAEGFSAKHYIWPGGAYTENAKSYAKEAKIVMCWDIGTDFDKMTNPPGTGDYGTTVRVPAENTGGTVTALQYVDEAIRIGVHVHLYMHDIVAGASGTNSTNTTEFQTLVTALKLRVNRGLCSVVTFDEYYNALVGD